ncbi:hypothetical protein DN752_11630 [Echinicola strongylocentroti]|uniref:phospholipase D n=1 Tax=Echinicola strongylocentroti TaxID=1795355 RepID=A0A2Z4IHX1_9BACT|nr:phospholipase D-like domain-containing protein [Echinicola strongylocentroti]AWW30722.1 hypothetical protein DN752_11630 [Echinicola strongylocentroti]
MTTFTKLLSEFKESLDDHALSRSEKREIKSYLTALTTHDRQVLLSDLFQMVQAKAPDVHTENLIAWFYEAVKILQEKDSPQATADVFFSPGNTCREAIMQEIRLAQSLIHICVFTISDNQISDELIHAHQRNVAVKVLTDDEKCFDLGSDIDRIRQAGIPVQTDHSAAHMHHKFAIFDQKKVLTGSYNWTRSAAEFNYENIVLLEDIHTVRAFEREFERLWKSFERGL